MNYHSRLPALVLLPLIFLVGMALGSPLRPITDLTDSTRIRKAPVFLHRNFLTPTGGSVEPGQFEWQNTWLVSNQFNAGFTKAFSSSFGVRSVSVFGADKMLVWFMPRVSFPVAGEFYKFTIGAIAGVEGSKSTGKLAFFTYHTLGKERFHITLGAGLGNTLVPLGDVYKENDPYPEFSEQVVLSLSGTWQPGKNIFILSENQFYHNPEFDTFDSHKTLLVRGVIRRFFIEGGLLVYTLRGSFFGNQDLAPILGVGFNLPHTF